MANSGGGRIFIGLDDDGKPTGWDSSILVAVDPAMIVDKLAKYTGEHFAGVIITSGSIGPSKYCRLDIAAAEGNPLAFERPGTYEVSPGQQKTSFSKGTVYFRHGAKSEPGTGKDLAQFIAREIRRTRNTWLSGIRRVVTAPRGSQVVFSTPAGAIAGGGGKGIRIVDDPRAPVFRGVDADITHPYRLKELVEEVNRRLAGRARIGRNEVLAIRKAHEVERKPGWFHKPRFGSPQYSDSFVEYLLQERARDEKVFEKARAAYKTISKKK